ncbi:bifunctional 3-(3-hydroxy-phenyl)propionate/3-hydroxycinnamic acid hydroxylase [Pseudomonas guariconensis]|uniref:bifunctional 3-(3-hydroxy-phenyl)propionate/3-hydroxycinnamic acid hydroxylase n=1 Tax=Pseudomonas guariconensis TaxID=1288410 RepID=UPI0018AA44D4|nr:bifunctional 3-(3-hydroxy-phenyl)propionate/3-hydroxycinnamic acid hydroxylase [Pseudomonas guariconensis]MBF8721782.1 bifunctional 3-(3-hydroxy-phenyl)propionate/3-hydroxycinnamic acid hydroxylase [Pseudomonas guariconensis]
MTALLRFNTEVLVVGAGPTGLTLANILGSSGVKTIIIDRNPSTVAEPRAVSIDDESLRTMQAIGLDDEVLSNVVAGYGVHYFTTPNGYCFGKVEPSSTLYGYPKRNAFRQPIFEATLRDGLQRFPEAEAWFGHELVSFTQDHRSVVARIRRTDGSEVEVQASYLVACDGGRSTVRKQLGVGLVGSSFNARWLVVDTDQDDDPFWQTRVYCDARRPVVDVPGPHKTRRFELMLKADERDEDVLADGRLRELLRPFRGDRPTSIVRKTVYTFHARVAERWQTGRVFLAGDAAHLTPPYAGQGMNSGVRDAHNLGWKLVSVTKGQIAPSALASYEIERRDHAWALIKLALNLGVVMAPSSVLKAGLISWCFRVIGLIPPLRDYFLQMRFKPKPRFVKGLVHGDGVIGTVRCGEMFPQPRLEKIDGKKVLLDDVIGSGFAAIQFGEPQVASLAKLEHPLWEQLEVKRIFILPAKVEFQPIPGCVVLRDTDGSLANVVSVGPKVVLLRPDRYIAAIFSLDHERETAESFSRLIGCVAPSVTSVDSTTASPQRF